MKEILNTTTSTINETEYNKYLDKLMGLDLTDEDETLFEDDMKYLSGEIRYF